MELSYCYRAREDEMCSVRGGFGFKQLTKDCEAMTETKAIQLDQLLFSKSGSGVYSEVFTAVQYTTGKQVM